MNTGVSPAPRLLALLFALSIVGLLSTLGMFAWMASSSSWDMGRMMNGGHMRGMMGGGGRDSSGGTLQRGSAEETVDIEDFAYTPGNLEVPVGASVTWTNRDSAPHSATANNGAWDTGVLARGERATVTFTTGGTFDYLCTVHPSMKARVVVQ